MASSMSLLGKILLLVGLSCFANSGMSMLRFRKYALQEESVESFEVPLDVKVEALGGLMLCIVGSILMYSFDLLIISGAYFYENKTSAQFH
eukprot:CAMPEP_0185581250 /NCGR_PEP_ID=MMETSP0434-20130131/18197_1 /TAXON_ID=626734 ORGANISM="Favella taraikaensis, Strain Fe Narragansett Bay" /NCGR_SAMPLE_ID=MMETSP0434 /ASSEMBLY_ACC=CAM_ASM_000379 /LENGTH=90 /DNA_ID=CAMNT_0028199739 /DNA_START=21 /DNA_END=293 /DNA_ORIENTATION=+